MRSWRVDADGVGVHVLDWRDAAHGTTQHAVLCIHGITANAHAFDGIARLLQPAFGVIAPDLRGRGESDAPTEGYGVVVHARDMLAVLDALALSRVDVVGWSLGARIAMQCAATYPEHVRRLVLLDPLLTTLTNAARRSLEQIQGRLGRQYRGWDDAFAAARAVPAYGPWSDAVHAFVRADLVEFPDGTVAHRVSPEIAEREWASMPPALSRILPAIVAPTLLLRATEPMLHPGDQVLPASDAARAVRVLRHGATADIPGVNHYSIALGEPRATVDAIRAFLLDDAPAP